MPALTKRDTLDFAGETPIRAREKIKSLLEADPHSARRIYAALAHKVWSLLVERRLDDELRDWHELLHGAKARIRGDDDAVSERLVALADLLRESISLAETSPAYAMARRPRAQRILKFLEKADMNYVPRHELKTSLEMGHSNLSNVLTQLAAHGLVERREKGKTAEFRLTRLGSQLLKPKVQQVEDVSIFDIEVFHRMDISPARTSRLGAVYDQTKLSSYYELSKRLSSHDNPKVHGPDLLRSHQGNTDDILHGTHGVLRFTPVKREFAQSGT